MLRFNNFGMPCTIGFNSGMFGNTNKKSKIYGVSWDKTANPTLTRTDNSIGMVANAGVDNQVVINDFDAAELFKDIHEVADSYGNVFIRIPKCYIGKTETPWTRKISKRPFSGSYLPWCFWDFDNAKELPYVDVGKYKASLSGDGKLESKSGKIPLINKNIVEFRNYALANNVGGLKGYQQLDIHVKDLIDTLIHIQFATINSQSISAGFSTGQLNAAHTAVITEVATNRCVLTNSNAANYVVGQTVSISTATWNLSVCHGRNITAINTYDASNKSIVFDGAPVNVSVGNIFHNTGQKNGDTDSVLAKTGSRISNVDGKRPSKIMGIESWWSDLWQFVDGVNINNNQAWVCPNSDQYMSNLFANPYKQIGYTNAAANDWVKYMGYDPLYPCCQFPITLGGGGQYYSDYYYQNTGPRIARVGGALNFGSNGGSSYWGLGSDSSAAHFSFSGRLLKKPL